MVRHQRLLALGPSLTSLTSDLTLVSPAFGRPDLASELPLVPRVKTRAKLCEFGEQTESMIHDRLVFGASDTRIKERLL